MNDIWSTYPKFLPPTLDRMRALLAKLGDPHLRLQNVIHVAGTNGKGSVIAYLNTILNKAGYICHVYTSPHLLRVNERIKVCDCEISDRRFNDLKAKVEMAARGMEVTWFEVLTCIAFLAFADMRASFVLLETGMGGLCDPTNVIDNPILTLITSISYDHQAQLGESLAEIVEQKAGILKDGVPAIIGANPFEVKALIKANSHGADIKLMLNETGVSIEDNKQLAQMAAAHLSMNGFKIEFEDIKTGVEEAVWPGRYQRLSLGEKFAHHALWLDGAHNEGGAKALSALLKPWKDKPLVMVLGMSASKDPRAFLMPFVGQVEHLIIPDLADDQFMPVLELSEIAEELGFQVQVLSSLDSCFDTVAGMSPSYILFTGSLYFSGKILSNEMFCIN